MKHHVTIYGTKSCTYCRVAKDFFNENNIAFEYHDVGDDDEARDQMVEISGQRGVPVILIGASLFVGFSAENKEKISKIFELTK